LLIPTPWSITATVALPFSRRIRTVMCVPAGEYLAALQQVPDHHLEAVAVDLGFQRLCRPIDLEIVSPEKHLHPIDRHIRDFDEVISFPVELQTAFFEARGFKHLLEYPVDLVGLCDEKRQNRIRFGRQLTQSTGLQHRQVSLDDGHRSAYLVRCDVEEVALGFFQCVEVV